MEYRIKTFVDIHVKTHLVIVKSVKNIEVFYSSVWEICFITDRNNGEGCRAVLPSSDVCFYYSFQYIKQRHGKQLIHPRLFKQFTRLLYCKDTKPETHGDFQKCSVPLSLRFLHEVHHRVGCDIEPVLILSSGCSLKCHSPPIKSARPKRNQPANKYDSNLTKRRTRSG